MRKRKTEEEIKQRFLDETKDHELRIILDDGVHRDIRFGQPDSSIYMMRITTWPGYLCVSGDMGTWVFRHYAIHDMLTFFRHNEINPQYWAEKIEAHCKHGTEDYCPETAKEIIEYHVNEWCEDREPEVVERFKAQVKDELLDHLGEWDETTCMREVMDFCWEVEGTTYERRTYPFQDAWDWGNFREYSYHYIWILWGIITVIAKYDESKEAECLTIQSTTS